MAFVAKYWQPVKPKGALLVSDLPEAAGRGFDEGSRRRSNPVLSLVRVGRLDTSLSPKEARAI